MSELRSAVVVDQVLKWQDLLNHTNLGLEQGEAWGSDANCQEDQPGRLCLRMNRLQDPCEVTVGSGVHLGLEVLGQGRWTDEAYVVYVAAGPALRAKIGLLRRFRYRSRVQGIGNEACTAEIERTLSVHLPTFCFDSLHFSTVSIHSNITVSLPLQPFPLTDFAFAHFVHPAVDTPPGAL